MIDVNGTSLYVEDSGPGSTGETDGVQPRPAVGDRAVRAAGRGAARALSLHRVGSPRPGAQCRRSSPHDRHGARVAGRGVPAREARDRTGALRRAVDGRLHRAADGGTPARPRALARDHRVVGRARAAGERAALSHAHRGDAPRRPETAACTDCADHARQVDPRAIPPASPRSSASSGSCRAARTSGAPSTA